MSFVSAHKSRILLGDFALSAKLTNFQLPIAVAMHDVTTIEDTAERFIPGRESSTIAASGYLDVETATDQASWTTNTPLTYGFNGLAIGGQVQMVDVLRANFATTSEDAPIGFSLNGQTDGASTFGVSLHDLGAETADGNHTSVDGTAASSSGAWAHLHVTAFSGLTNSVFTVEDSADNVSFATIGTFTTVTGVTSERIAIAGTVRRYVRAVTNVTGIGSVTFACAISRL